MKLTTFLKKRKSYYDLQSNSSKLILGLIFCLFATQIEAQRYFYYGVNGGVISTNDATTICVDGIPDVIKTKVRGARGRAKRWVVTDDRGTILAVQRRLQVDFDAAGAGTCFIYNVSFNYIRGLRKGRSIRRLRGFFDLSNRITVVRTEPKGGTITGGPFEFTVDGQPDFATGIELAGNQGGNSQWVITDEAGKILGLPPTPDVVNFDDAGAGVCLIWHLSFEDGLQGATPGNNATTDLIGCYSLSNPIRVIRNEDTTPTVEGGTLTGGPFEFCVDGEADFATGIELTGNTGSNSLWIITDDTGKILGTPPSPEVVNFDDAGAGTCFIYHASFEGELTGATAGNNVSTDLAGNFALSNALAVVRNEPKGGTITGGPFAFVIDGQPDFAKGLVLTGNQGKNSQWVITDNNANILGLPPSPDVVNFDDAGTGVCLIWHLSFEDGLQGLIAGKDLTADLTGCYSLSNPVPVLRTNTPTVEGGTLTGGPFEFCVDGEADFATGIELADNTGNNSLWIITDDTGNILGTPPSPEVVNFDDAGIGTCFIYHASFEGELTGASAGNNVNTDLKGNFALSNSLKVERTACTPNPVEGGTISAGTLEFCVGDGQSDFIGTVTIGGERGDNSQWLITNETGDILGLPLSPLSVDFDNAGAGVCLIYHLSFQNGLQGLIVGNNVNNDLTGTFDLSNALRVIRTACNFAPLAANIFVNPSNNELSVTVSGGNTSTELFVNFITFGGGNAGSSPTEIFSSADGSTVTFGIDTSNITSGTFIARVVDAKTFKQLATMTYINK